MNPSRSALALALALVTVVFAQAHAAVFSNASPISIAINPNGPASLYPSTINVSNFSGTLGEITVTLHNVSHTFPDDMDMLLVAPTGQKFILVSDSGGSSPITNVTVSFNDAAPALIPDTTSWTNGLWKPGNYSATVDTFDAPAPAQPYQSPATNGTATLLSTFTNIVPNGAWSLYVMDDSRDDGGTIAGGWSLSISTVKPATLTAITRQAPNSVVLTGTGSAGASVAIWSSATVSNFTSHASVTVNSNGVWQFVEATTNAVARFYRLNAP
jgi:subtilisin-like proprotein convertase family protein